MKKLIFIILILLPLIGLGQAEKPYRSIIIDSLKALNGGSIDAKDTVKFEKPISIGGSVDASAILTITSTTQGMLVPRMNTTARNLISSPTEGLLIYNTQTQQYEYFETTWKVVGLDGNGLYSGSGSLASSPTIVTMGANSLQFTSSIVDGFSIDGTTFSVDANNNRVGIGTATPITALTVHGTATLSSPGLNIRTFAEFKRTSGVDAYLRIGDSGGLDHTVLYGRSNLDSEGLLIIGELGSGHDVASNAGKAALKLQGISDGGGVVDDASTLFSLMNATRKKWQVLGNGNTMFAGDFDPQLLTPEALLDLPNTADLPGLLVRANSVGLLDGALLNSPTFEVRAYYDSDPTGGITTAEFDATMQTFVTTGGALAQGRFAISIEGGEAFSIDETQKTTLRGIDATSSNFVWIATDNVATQLATIRNDGLVTVSNSFATTGKSMTLGVGISSFSISSNLFTLTGDGAGNTIATITGATDGHLLTIIFTDANVTITDDNSHGADSIDLSAAFTGADDTTLQIMHDGTSWYEVSRSVN